jgi:type IV secretory pathway VirB10-like protein
MTASTSSFGKSLGIVMVIAASAMACGSAFAQWQWIDATGRKVYSDTAPPRTIPDKNILKRPGAPAALASPESAAPAEASAEAAKSAPVPQPPAVDPKLEAKRIEAEKAEAARKKAEEDKRNQARAENCERAKRSLATLNSGIRIRTTNAKGEAEIMDDAARAAESRRVEGIVSNDCGPVKAPVARQGTNSVP